MKTLLITGYHGREREFGRDFLDYFCNDYPLNEELVLYEVQNPVLHSGSVPKRAVFKELEDVVEDVRPARIIDVHHGYLAGRFNVFFSLFWLDKRYPSKLKHMNNFNGKPEDIISDIRQLDNERIELIRRFRIPYYGIEAMLYCERITEAWQPLLKNEEYESAMLCTANLANALHSIPL